MSNFLNQQPIILASASLARQKLLYSVGLNFEIIPADVDEEAIKQQFDRHYPFTTLARILAAAKALTVSKHYPESFVIAADQLCVIGDEYLDKPGNHEIATLHLQKLRGKTHQQIAACCIAKDETIIWETQETASLTMNNLSDNMIDAYLKCDKPYQSCGAYNYEGRAKWLFERVEGSDCTVLGLPLLPLTQALSHLDIVIF